MRMNSERRALKSAVATIFLLSCAPHAQEPQALSLKNTIELQNVDNRIDHFSVDVKGQRLFVAALGNHTLEVVDLGSDKCLQTLTGLAEPQGVYYDGVSDRLFVAYARDGATKVFDGTSYQLLATIKFAAGADNIRYDARERRVIVGYGDGALADRAFLTEAFRGATAAFLLSPVDLTAVDVNAEQTSSRTRSSRLYAIQALCESERYEGPLQAVHRAGKPVNRNC